MKNNFTKKIGLLLVLTVFAFVQNGFNQCGIRYHNLIFNDSIVSNLTYGWNIKTNNQVDSLKLDIYLPKGDIETSRPVIILAHGGNFIGGSKTGADVVPLCKNLCQMGYVTVSINYRLGFTNFPFPGPDSTDAAETVMRAVHDGRAAVRYLRKTFENGNPYGIDTSLIFFGGVSAGGILASHLGYLDDMSEWLTYIDTVNQPGLSGSLWGNSGNPGYRSDVFGIINICGALGDSAWMHSGDAPLLSFHGDVDNTVPNGSALIYLLGAYPLLQVDGSESMAARANQMGIINCYEKWEGRDHTPQVSNATYYDSMLVITRNFLAHFVCGDALNCSYGPAIVGVDELNEATELKVYPNPSSQDVVLELGNVSGVSAIQIYDMSGRIILSENFSGSRAIIARNNHPAGMYLIVVKNQDQIRTARLVFE